MIKLKEGVTTKLIIEVTNEGLPYDGEVSFGIYDKKGEVIWQKEIEAMEGIAEITLPKIKENDYRFTLETDDGYSDIQDLIVSKSIREPKGELQRKYQIDINNQWDEKYEKNIGKNKILMNEFYMNNGKRLKKLESDIEEHKGRMDMDKGEVMEHIGKGNEEMKKELEDFSKVIGSKVEGVSRELVSFEKSSEEKTNMIIEDLETFKTDTNDKINQTEKTINTITETIGDISKKSDENGLSISDKITRIEKKIPTGGILDYEVDDEGLSATILWSSEKIDKRIRGEVGRQKKYVSYQNMFDTIAVSGQDSLQPTSPLDELTIVATGGMNITTDSETNTLTFDSAGDSSLEVTQNAHGFVALDWLYYDSSDSTFKKAQANSISTLGSWHVVEVVDANTFKVAKDGVYSITNALALGEYVLSDATAGGYTQTVPGDLGEYVLYGMEVISGTEVSFYTSTAVEVGVEVEGNGTANQITYWTDSSTLGALDTATYPSLTELSYVKGVTSALQTQLNALVPYTGATADLNLGTYDILSDTRRATTSAGMLIESANGTDVGLLGAGNTANVTWYGNHNYSTATQDTIAIFTGAGKTLGSAATATYPSLTELAHVKGATSAIQTQLNDKLGLSGGTVTGAIVLDENASLQLDGSLSADGKWSGTTITGTAGYTQAFGDLVYLDPTDSRWEAVDISVAAGANGDARGLLGMVVSAGTDGTACTILLQGTIRADANFPTLTIGAPVYASTSGDIVVTQPVTTDYVIRIVGSALTADSIYFSPGASWTTHT